MRREKVRRKEGHSKKYIGIKNEEMREGKAEVREDGKERRKE